MAASIPFQTVPFALMTPGKSYFIETTKGEHLAVRVMDYPSTEAGKTTVVIRTFTGPEDVILDAEDVKVVRAS